MLIKTVKFTILLFCSSLLSSQLYAEQKPLWELGVGVATLYNPHYLGADEGAAYVLPIPYFNYYGKKFRADRGGIRGFLYSSEKINFGLSAGGALPVNSDDSDTREGMDDLDIQMEIGPVLEYQLFKDDKHLLRFDFPIRGAFLLGDQFLRHQGWTSNPRFYYETDIKAWQVSADVGALWSDQRYHAYIYDVDNKDVTLDRPFYQSESGFTASRFNIGVKRRFKDCYFGECYIGAKLRYYNLKGADNNNSPLVKKEDYWAASFVVAWILSKSDKTVDVD